MKRWWKWSLGLVGLLLVLVVGVAVFDYQRHERQRLERSVDQLASLEQEFADLRAGWEREQESSDLDRRAAVRYQLGESLQLLRQKVREEQAYLEDRNVWFQWGKKADLSLRFTRLDTQARDLYEKLRGASGT
jgi:hypothetical protein